jgi:hypothetical protein
MDKIEFVLRQQGSDYPSLSQLGIKVADRPESMERQLIRQEPPDSMAPDIYEAVGDVVDAVGVIWKCFFKLGPSARMYEQMHVNIHLSQMLEKLIGDKRLAAECCGGMLGDKEYLQQLARTALLH